MASDVPPARWDCLGVEWSGIAMGFVLDEQALSGGDGALEDGDDGLLKDLAGEVRNSCVEE